MNVAQIWGKMSACVKKKPEDVETDLCSEKEVRFLIERERALADRNSHKFSLLIFNHCGLNPNNGCLNQLVEILKGRIRATDNVGWFGSKRIGAILPHTNEEGAKTLYEDIYKIAQENNLNTNSYMFSIHTYPSYNNSVGNKKTDSSVLFSNFSNYGILQGQFEYKQELNISNLKIEPQLSRPGLPFWKRTMDIIGSSAGLFFLSPVFLAVAVLIKIVSKGPVFFKQERVGYLEKTFTCWKFRTMKLNNKTEIHKKHFSTLIHNEAPMIKLDSKGDSRIIPMGNFLRKTCIDELPQLINVFKGEMSLIGPRPCLPYEAEEFSPWQKQRFEAVPGMTGLWQVSGKNHTTFKKMMRLDINYAKNLSFFSDTMILLKTIPTILGQLMGKISK